MADDFAMIVVVQALDANEAHDAIALGADDEVLFVGEPWAVECDEELSFDTDECIMQRCDS